MAPKTDVQKNPVCRQSKKSEFPTKSTRLRQRLIRTLKLPQLILHVDSKQKNEFHFPENREIQTKLLAELVQNEGPVHFDYAR